MKSLAPSPGPGFLGVTLFLFLWCLLALVSNVLGSDLHLHLLDNADDLKVTPLPDLHHHTAEKLCTSLDNTQILDQFKLLWSFIQPKDDQEQKQIQIQKQKQQNCHVYRWKKCSGEARFPLSSNCGFFEVVQLPADKCGQAITAKVKAGVKAGVEAIDQEKENTYVDHARAVQLCSMLNEVPEEKQQLVQFTPILVDNEISSVNSLLQKCVFWKYAACGVVIEEGCGQWKLAINPVTECKPFLHYYDAPKPHNNTETQKLTKDYSTREVDDFIQSTTKEEEHLNFGSELKLLKDLISCERRGTTTTCHIMKQVAPSTRTKREVSHTNNIRKKRQYYRYGRRGGRRPGRPRQHQPCWFHWS